MVLNAFMEVHGRDHTVGVAPAKLSSLVSATEALLQRGESTGRELRSLVGKWSWAFLARRPAFAVFSAVYRFMEAAQARTFQIWASVERELRTAIGLAPLLFSSLSWDWFGRVFASDASHRGRGGVATDVTAADAQNLADKPPPTETADRSLDPLLEGRRWTTLIAAQWRYSEHINILEARALSAALRRVLSSRHAMRRKLLTLCDSLVVVYATRKGRSSKYPLLRRLREIASLVWLGDSALYQLHCI